MHSTSPRLVSGQHPWPSATVCAQVPALPRNSLLKHISGLCLLKENPKRDWRKPQSRAPCTWDISHLPFMSPVTQP